MTDPADREDEIDTHPHGVGLYRDRYADMIEEFRKREKSQDAVRQLLTAERDEARAAIERVKALHSPAREFPVGKPPHDVCAYDTERWPCLTIVRIEGQP